MTVIHGGLAPLEIRETVTRQGRRVRAYMDVFTACLPDLERCGADVAHKRPHSERETPKPMYEHQLTTPMQRSETAPNRRP